MYCSEGVHQLVRRNGLLILGFTAAGLLQWAYIKIVAVSQPSGEFGRFVATIHFTMILTTPLVSLQGAISRQVARLIAGGRRDALLPYLYQRLRSWSIPIAVVAAAVLLLAKPLAGQFDLGDPMALVLLTAILIAFLPFQACLGFLAGADRFRALVALLVFETGLRCGLALALPGVVATTTGALAVSLAALLLAVGAAMVLVRRGRVRDAVGTDPDEALQSTLPAFLAGAVAFSLLAYQETLVVRLVLSPQDSADYSAAIVISRLLLVMAYPLVPAMVPLITKRQAAGEGTRRVLVFHLVILITPAIAFVVTGMVAPGLLGGLLLDAEKHSGLGHLLPLAFASAAFLAGTHISLHYLFALRRFLAVPLVVVAVAAGYLLIVTADPSPVRILERMTWLTGITFAVTTVLALIDPRRGDA